MAESIGHSVTSKNLKTFSWFEGGQATMTDCIKKPKGRWVCWKTFTAAPLNLSLPRFPAYYIAQLNDVAFYP